jgi:8-oxo-dGTP diphosphatase
VIVDDLDRPTQLLAARRRTGAPESIGRWEFPGGKVEPGESPQEALRRELSEELAVETVIGAEVGDGAGWRITDRLALRLFTVRVVDSAVVAGADHDQLRWLGADELGSVDWLESDRAALPAVRAVLDVVG